MNKENTVEQTGGTRTYGPIRWESDADGIVKLTFDAPGKSANTYDEAFTKAWAEVIDLLNAEVETIRGVVITSAKKSFFAGGDLHELLAADRFQAAELAASFNQTKAVLRRLENLGRPVVAAINGAALGGGYEIALACHWRIAVEAPAVRVGLPEVTFGLLPGGGGVARSVRLLGADVALDKLLLTGATYWGQGAIDLGLVDELVETEADLFGSAKRWILDHPQGVNRWDTDDYKMPGPDPRSVKFANAAAPWAARIRNMSKGAPSRATRNILAAAIEGAKLTLEGATAVETDYFVDLLVGRESKNRIKGGFIDLQAVKSGAARPDGVPQFEVTHLGVVGAGMMGAGIAYVAARRGINVVLQDTTTEAAEKGKEYSVNLLNKAVERGQLTREDADQVLARITPVDNSSALTGCQAVIEAVFENPELKAEIYSDIEKYVDDLLIASNTSTLPVSGLAKGTRDPKRFIGMHFFSPVDRMQPVEIVVGEQTSDKAIAQAIDLSRALGKMPIVVNDGRGFFTSRVIGTFIDEAAGMLAEGIAAASIEQAGLQAGYPSAPLKLMDEVSFSLRRTVRRETKAAVLAEGGTWDVHPAEPVMDRMLDEFNRSGRREGAGFYEYVDGRRVGLWPGLAENFGASKRIPMRDMVERMLFAEALETVGCIDDGVIRSIADANVGSVLAIGFPAWTGGVVQYMNGYEGGIAGFAARAHELASLYGDRFTPPQSLVERAKENRPFE